MTLGIGGGPLIVALSLGKLRRTGPLLWTMPLPANIVLRNFGLALFLAAVGINAGQPFVQHARGNRPDDSLYRRGDPADHGAHRAAGRLLPDEIPYDDLVGVASGATGNPAILVYSTRMAPTERPDIGYAMIFPSMTIVKVIAVQIVGLLAPRSEVNAEGEPEMNDVNPQDARVASDRSRSNAVMPAAFGCACRGELAFERAATDPLNVFRL